MKIFSTCLVVLLIVSAATVYAAPAGQIRAPQQAQEEKAFEGALIRIDSNAHMLVAKGSDDKEWQFTYTEATQVTGPEKSVQGLAGKPGSLLKITYRVEQGKNIATHIDVAPEK
jgi:hypothetical protein